VLLLLLSSSALAWDETYAIDSALLDRAKAVLAETAAQQDVTHGNFVGLVGDGYQALVLRIHLIRAARVSIDIQTFILENDECGRLLTYELIEAAKRGVRVRLLADHFMSSREPRWVAALATAHPNFTLKYYRPTVRHIRPHPAMTLLNGLLFFRGSNQRMHNKVFLVDGAVALTGGRNIDNHYYNHSTSYNFIDMDALLLGPKLPLVQASFDAYWAHRKSIDAAKLIDVARAISQDSQVPLETRSDYHFNGFFEDVDRDALDAAYTRKHFLDTLVAAQKVTFLVDKPGKNGWRLLPWGGSSVTEQLRKMIRATENELVIQSPYLILNYLGRRNFKKLRKQNPDAEVLVSTNSFAATDNTLAYSANYKMRSTYIERLGFQIFEYMPRPDDFETRLPNHLDLERRAREDNPAARRPFLCIHAKTIVRDARIAYVGSYNFDPRSDNLNSEAGLLIEDETLAAALRESILRCMAPDSSWVIAKKELALSEINALIEGLSGITPVDLWPLRNTSSFELREGAEPVPPDHPDFYTRYRDAGSFPGAEGLSTKQVVTYVYKMLNTLAIPVL
jgi:phosphatidylserine/phosphatidylglycerophosphate/cardiolipin synthase-like enzyme